MSEKKQQTAYPLRMPQALRDQLEASSAESKRSLNAEIIARLEETFEIEEVLASIAPGASFAGTAGFLVDLHEDLKEHAESDQHLAVAAASEEVARAMSQISVLSQLLGFVVLQAAHPDAVDDAQRERLMVVIGRMFGSDSRDPSELATLISERLLAHTLEAEIDL